ncbi:MAG: ketopantoate reductase family protein [Negativicutes bacterium]
MKYAILGAGAMGSIIGATLAKGGQEVVLVDPYKDHIEKIARDGLQLKWPDRTETVRLGTCTNPAEASPADMVVLLVKGFHSEAAVKGAPGLFGESTYICSLQNGLGNDDILAGMLPRERILQGVMRMTGSLAGPGEVLANLGGDVAIYLGSITQQEVADDMARTMAGHLCAGGLVTEFSAHVAEHVWAKVVMNACVNGTCGIVRLRARDYFNHPEGFRTVQDITREVVAVAAVKGVTLDYDALIADMLAAVARAGEHYPSMAQDIRGKRKTEIDSLNGAIARYGRELGIQTPANDYVTRFVKIIEDNYAAQF